MEIFPSITGLALPATALLLLTFVVLRIRQRIAGRGSAARDALDTVVDWPPESARVMTVDERAAYDLLRRALPGYLVLSQVPLARFIRVPLRRSYGEWLQRVGSLSADVLICDGGSRVLAVVDIRSPNETERSKRRHERMTRVLEAARIQVHVWREGSLPTIGAVRLAMAGLSGPAAEGYKPVPSGAMPLIPVPEIHEILAEGDRAAFRAGPNIEPVPSGFFEELEATQQQR